MIKPALQDDAFLADVRAACEDRDSLHLWWLGQAGFLVQHDTRHLLIDPYLSDSLTKKYAGTDKPHLRMSERVIDPRKLNFIDVVCSTHNHTDHLDASTLWPLIDANPKLRIIVPLANVQFAAERLDLPMTRFIGLAEGDSFDFDITAVPAAHPQREFDSQGHDKFVGYVVEVGGQRIYHSGDTMRFDGLAERVATFGQIDLALLPINGMLGNMNATDAAGLAKEIGSQLLVPCHYDMFEFNTVSPDACVKECKRIGQPIHVLKLGERLTL